MNNDEINNGNPRHIAIIMDGNGRWAQKRFMPRVAGHAAGVKAVKRVVDYCINENIAVLSLFAFSSENWRRPKQEVSMLMDLFMGTLQAEINRMDKKNIRLLIIGDKTAFSSALQVKIDQAHSQTANNTGLTLVIAANYGGRWDIAQASQKIALKIQNGELAVQAITEQLIDEHLSTAGLPEPDLFIRSGGEQRVSNFLLWQLAYTEFFFTDALWPDFDATLMAQAVENFKHRLRRFGRTSEQVLKPHDS